MTKHIHSAVVKDFEKDFLARFNASRGSLRNLILMSEKVDESHNKSTFNRLKYHFAAVNAAFEILEVKKPKKPTSNDEKYIENWVTRDLEVPDDYGEK